MTAPITVVEGTAYPFGMKNCDTDVIIAAEWLKTISRTGLGKGVPASNMSIASFTMSLSASRAIATTAITASRSSSISSFLSLPVSMRYTPSECIYRAGMVRRIGDET